MSDKAIHVDEQSSEIIVGRFIMNLVDEVQDDEALMKLKLMQLLLLQRHAKTSRFAHYNLRVFMSVAHHFSAISISCFII